MYYPLDIRHVLLVPEDSVHYGILGPYTDAEWKSIPPPGGEFVQLGHRGRTFAIALYHQMHCLDIIRRAIGDKSYTNHVHHCFNYLREAVLCEADTTIEPGVPGVAVNREWSGDGVTSGEAAGKPGAVHGQRLGPGVQYRCYHMR